MAGEEIKPICAESWKAMASEVLVATADVASQNMQEGVCEILSLLRNYMNMDVVFVSELLNGRRVFKYVDVNPERPVITAGDSSPLEQSWCQRVVDGRLPELIPNVADLPDKDQLPKFDYEIGTHISTPVMHSNGRLFGTLCAFSFSPNEAIRQDDLKNLKAVAAVLAEHLKDPIM